MGKSEGKGINVLISNGWGISLCKALNEIELLLRSQYKSFLQSMYFFKNFDKDYDISSWVL